MSGLVSPHSDSHDGAARVLLASLMRRITKIQPRCMSHPSVATPRLHAYCSNMVQTFTHWIATTQPRCILRRKVATPRLYVYCSSKVPPLTHGIITINDSTPLHVASAASPCGNAKVARLLLEHGANIHVRNKEDQTPQHLLLTMWSDRY